jgi:hypothetical protein
VASLVEFGEKYTSNKNKLSIRFGPIVGIIKEADYWAGKDAEEVPIPTSSRPLTSIVSATTCTRRKSTNPIATKPF